MSSHSGTWTNMTDGASFTARTSRRCRLIAAAVSANSQVRVHRSTVQHGCFRDLYNDGYEPTSWLSSLSAVAPASRQPRCSRPDSSAGDRQRAGASGRGPSGEIIRPAHGVRWCDPILDVPSRRELSRAVHRDTSALRRAITAAESEKPPTKDQTRPVPVRRRKRGKCAWLDFIQTFCNRRALYDPLPHRVIQYSVPKMFRIPEKQGCGGPSGTSSTEHISRCSLTTDMESKADDGIGGTVMALWCPLR